MTAQRREMKRGSLFVAAFATLALGSGAGVAGTNERVVVDRYTGLAISGFDPVVYFTAQEAHEGRATFELSEGGAIWRFRNHSNRASFAAHPEIYAPQFGGYDPVDVARGVARAGRPQIWAVIDQKLYLFADENSRAQFVGANAASRCFATDRWPEVEAALAR